jgi:hypothetical protein
MTFLVGGIVIITGVLGTGFAPLVKCPQLRKIDEAETRLDQRSQADRELLKEILEFCRDEHIKEPCAICGQRGRISIFRTWASLRNVQER